MDMQTEQTILTRLLPKTQQAISYQTGDDGYYQKGWRKGRTVATNQIRYIAKTLNGDEVVIDLATGLMWPRSTFGAGGNSSQQANWTNTINYGLGLIFAGFTDWRIPNINELASLIDYSKNSPAIDDIFTSAVFFTAVWSSTTYYPPSSDAWCIDFSDGLTYGFSKTTSYSLLCVRSLP